MNQDVVTPNKVWISSKKHGTSSIYRMRSLYKTRSPCKILFFFAFLRYAFWVQFGFSFFCGCESTTWTDGGALYIVLRDWYDNTVDALALSTCVGLTQVNEEKTWASWLSFIVTTSANDIDVEKNCSCSALLLWNVALTYCVKGNFCFDFRTFNTCYAYFFKFYSVFNHYQDVNSSSQFICLILGLSLKLSSCQAERTSSSPLTFFFVSAFIVWTTRCNWTCCTLWRGSVPAGPRFLTAPVDVQVISPTQDLGTIAPGTTSQWPQP